MKVLQFIQTTKRLKNICKFKRHSVWCSNRWWSAEISAVLLSALMELHLLGTKSPVLCISSSDDWLTNIKRSQLKVPSIKMMLPLKASAWATQTVACSPIYCRGCMWVFFSSVFIFVSASCIQKNFHHCCADMWC